MKIGLVLEGGAMRGMFTAGVLDVMMENGIEFGGAVGVSAGAAFGCNIKSRQPGRAIRYNKKYCKDKNYVSMRSWLTTGDIYNVNFGYTKIPYVLDPFDTKTFAENPMEFYVVATDMETGRPLYHRCKDGEEYDLKWIRASASMPVVSRPVKIGGRLLSDGGTSDSIPLKFMESRGYAKNVVILTQPAGFVKEQRKHFGVIKAALSKYPGLVRALEKRPDMYNAELAYVRAREKSGDAFVICPPAALGIGSVCHDPDELERVYQIGRHTAIGCLTELEKFTQG